MVTGERVYIYTLSDPITFQVRYVGQTINLKQRFNKHINTCFTLKTHVACWIKSLQLKNLTPIIDEIDCVENIDCDLYEKMYISLFKSWGFNLTNLTDGGKAGAYKINTTVKNKISKTLTGLSQKESTKLKRKLAVKKAWSDVELRQRQSITTKNLWITGVLKNSVNFKRPPVTLDETKNKISQGLKEYYKTHSVYNKKTFDIETINKIKELYNNGYTVFKLHKEFKIARTTIKRILNEN